MGTGLDLEEILKKDHILYSQFEDVKKFSEKIWENNFMPWFTNHDPEHSKEIIGLLNQVLEPLSSSNVYFLSEHEIYILLSAAYLHDIGMQHLKKSGKSIDTLTQEDYDSVRKWHALESFNIITSRFETLERDGYRFPDIDEHYIPAIAKVSKGHATDFFEDVIDGFKKNPETPVNRVVRCELLTALLMIGDELDLHGKRVEFSKLRNFIPSDFSLSHWFKHHYVDLVKVNYGAVTLNLKFPQNSESYQYLIKNEIVDKLAMQIDKVKVIFREQTHGLLNLSISESDVNVFYDDTGIKRPMPEKLIKYFRPRKASDSDKIIVKPVYDNVGFQSTGSDTPVQNVQNNKNEREYNDKQREETVKENINKLLNDTRLKMLRESLIEQLKSKYDLEYSNEIHIEHTIMNMEILKAIRILKWSVQGCMKTMKDECAKHESLLDIWNGSVDILGWLLLSVDYQHVTSRFSYQNDENLGMKLEISVLSEAGIEIVFSSLLEKRPVSLDVNESKISLYGKSRIRYPEVESGWKSDDHIRGIKKNIWRAINKFANAQDTPCFIDPYETQVLNGRIAERNEDLDPVYFTISGADTSCDFDRKELLSMLSREFPALHIISVTIESEIDSETIFIVPEPKLVSSLLEFFLNKPE